ncbi:hypothetical protein, conserved, partial [Eimeria maxima]
MVEDGLRPLGSCIPPNTWVWVAPARYPLGAPQCGPQRGPQIDPRGGPRRLVRLLAIPSRPEDPTGGPCRCWLGALSVPKGKWRGPPIGAPSPTASVGEETKGPPVNGVLSTTSPHSHPPEVSKGAPQGAPGAPAEGPSEGPTELPCIFLPGGVLHSLGVSAGGEINVWEAKDIINRSSGSSLPPPFRGLPIARRCQLQQLYPPNIDTWAPLGAPNGGGPLYPSSSLEAKGDTQDVLVDFFCVPRLLSLGDTFAVLKVPYRYGAPSAGCPCSGGGPQEALPEGAPKVDPQGAPNRSGGPVGAPANCPCCLSLHEVEHAERYGQGGPRCMRLRSRLLLKENRCPSWGPLFVEGPIGAPSVSNGPTELGDPPQGDPRDNGEEPRKEGGAAEGHEGAPSPSKRLLQRPPTQRVLERSPCFSRGAPRGAPLCHWGPADAVFGWGAAETLHDVAFVFRVSLLETNQDPTGGPPGEGGPPGAPQGGRNTPLCAVVVRDGTDLLLQEAPIRGAPPPFLVSPLAARGDRGSLLLCGDTKCGALFLLRRVCDTLGLNCLSLNCAALSPAAAGAAAAAAKGIVHADGSVAPGGNSALSAALVEGAHRGGPCVILLQNLTTLMEAPGAPSSRQDRLDALLAAHLRWFLGPHRQIGGVAWSEVGGGPLGGPQGAPVVVVGVCEGTGDKGGDNLLKELRNAFEVIVSINRPDEETREI